jgi:hypothetical protein
MAPELRKEFRHEKASISVLIRSFIKYACVHVEFLYACSRYELGELQPVSVLLFATCLHENALVFQLQSNGVLPLGWGDVFHGGQVDCRSQLGRGTENGHLAVAHYYVSFLPDWSNRALDIHVAGHRLKFCVRARSNVVPTGSAM